MADFGEATITLKPDEIVAALLQINQKLDAVIDGIQQIAGMLDEENDDECPQCGDAWVERTTMGCKERKFVCPSCGEAKTEPFS